MKRWSILLLLLLLFVAQNSVHAQCAHDPLVTGDSILCPNAVGMLSTQAADSFQWYKREYGTGNTVLIPGETAQTINIGPNDVLFYFSVDATLSGCTERSPEVLVDGYAFLLPYVIHTGDFTTGGNGESIICTGDTMYLTMGLPYDTLITWYRNGNVIPGADSTVLVVTTAGIYTSQGAPSICPDFIQQLGVNIEVVEINCGVGVVDAGTDGISIFPNPAHESVQIRSEKQPLLEIRLLNALGQCLLIQAADDFAENLDLSGISKGLYWLEMTTEGGRKTMPLRLM
jgi:hypothetical protein